MKPLKNNVIIRKESVDNKTSGGIILDSKPKTQMLGEIIAVGPDVVSVALGDIAYFTEVLFVGTHEGKPVFIINEEKIFATE
jgi:co-chaperonin GroES (HSP10)